MDTIKKSVNIYLVKYGSSHGKTDLACSFDVQESCSYFTYAKIGETTIDVPILSDAEELMIMNGALLESVKLERQRYKEESIVKLAMLDERIKELQCIEFKAEDHKNG